jgi:hypothetical protein
VVLARLHRFVIVDKMPSIRVECGLQWHVHLHSQISSQQPSSPS